MIEPNPLPDRLSMIAKAPSGCAGLDEITGGGLPAGRPTLVCGGPGCGKTVLAMEFLVRGALEHDEPGLFVSFEESSESLVENFRSLGFDLEGLIEQKKLVISQVELSLGEIVETGDFTFDALLIRLEHAVGQVGAKRVVLDTMESLFSALSASTALRREITRLFHWLRDKGLTTIVTAERGTESFTRYGIEEYVSDCVLLLDHRVEHQISKRRLRVVKYRGSSHGADEYPFLIGEHGFSVFPITSVGLGQTVGTNRVSTGIEDLDGLLGGEGYFEGSTVLLSGKAGTGKSSLSAAFLDAACRRGERCVYVSSEESASQIERNMRSIGIDLEPWSREGLLSVDAVRPSLRGLEEHLVVMMDAIEDLDPSCVVIDPITNFISIGDVSQVRSMLTRFLSTLKTRGITVVLTALVKGSGSVLESGVNVSSMTDTWIALDMEVMGRTRRREIQIVKSRGMDHSLERAELVMSAAGLSLGRLSPDGSEPEGGRTGYEP